MQRQEVELFHDYELRGWEPSPRLYKIIGVAAAMHLFAFIVVGQMNLFGTKACDSPYVSKVCQVLDAAYVSSVLLGTEMEFSSRDYEKTEINPEDVTFIDVSEQFTYPSGYFAMSNPAPEMYDPMIMPSPTYDNSVPGFPGMTVSPPTLDPTQPQVLPTPNPNAVQGSIPESPFSVGGNNPPVVTRNRKFPTVRTPKVKNNSPKTLPEIPGAADSNKQTADANKAANSNTTAGKENKPKTTEGGDAEENKLFNKKPLEDFGEKYGEAILNKEVDINAPFEIEVKGALDENGKLVKPTMTVKPGSDAKMTEVAKEAISAFSDSQLLRALYEAGVRGVSIKFSQDQSNLMAIIQSDAGTPSKAGSIQSSVNLAKKLALATMKPESDEAKLIGKAETATNGKIFILNFLIPNEEKAPMIEKNLKSLQEKLKNKQPNSGVAETLGKEVKSTK